MYREGEIKLKHRLTDSQDRKITFFPLAVDDYFMAVAIISGKLNNDEKVNNRMRY